MKSRYTVPFNDHRLMTEGINHCYRTRIPWCDPPDHLGSSKTARKRHRRYAGDGTRDSVLATLLGHAEAKGPINCEVSVDSTVPPHMVTCRMTRICRLSPRTMPWAGPGAV